MKDAADHEDFMIPLMYKSTEIVVVAHVRTSNESIKLVAGSATRTPTGRASSRRSPRSYRSPPT